MNNFLKTRLDKLKKEKRKNDRMLKLFIFIFFAGYALFFLSPYYLPKVYKYSDIVVIGKLNTFDNCMITVDTWDYSKRDKSFEIIAEIDNFTVDGKTPEMRLRIGNSVNVVKVKKKIKPNIYVLEINKVPRMWNEASLSINIEDSIFHLHMNDKKVHRVDEIKDRSDKEYVKYMKERKVKGLNEYIDALNKDISKNHKQMNKIYNKIEELDKRAKNLTDEDKREIEAQKSKLANEYSDIKQKQDENLKQIDLVKGKIKLEEKK